MKEAMGQYGAVILAFTIFFAISTSIYCGKIWNDMTFPQVIGFCLSQSTLGKLEDTGTGAFFSYQMAAKPNIQMKEQEFYAGDTIALSQLLEAKDYQGALLSVSILEARLVYDAEEEGGMGGAVNTDTADNYVVFDGGQICFEKSGIYRITARSTDSDLRRSIVVINVPVQRRITASQ